MRLSRRILALLTALAAVVLLSACGSSSSDVGSAQDVLNDAFGGGGPLNSGTLDATVQFNSKGLKALDGPVNVTLKGPFQSGGGKTFPAFDLDLALNVAGAAISAGAVSTGTDGYVKFEGTAYKLSDKFAAAVTQAFKNASSKGGKGLSLGSLGINPRRWLRSPEKIGTEKVDGTDTTHVAAQIDVPSLLGDVDTLLGKAAKLAPAGGAFGIPTQLSPTIRTGIELAVKSATVDVWSGVDDGTLRRMLIKVGFVIPEIARSIVGGLQQGNVSIDVGLSDVNKPQTITAPSGAHPISGLLAQFSKLFGGVLGGIPGSSDHSSGSGSSAPSPKYLTCLSKAGADAAKIQACADLLTK